MSPEVLNFVQMMWKCLISIIKSTFGGIFEVSAASSKEHRVCVFPRLNVTKSSSGIDENVLLWWVNNPKNIQTALHLLKNCNHLAKFAKDSSIDSYLTHLLVSLLPYFAQKVMNVTAKTQLLNTVTAILRDIATTGRCGVWVGDSLAEELWVHHADEDQTPASSVGTESTTRALFSAWMQITSSFIQQQKSPQCSPPCLSAAIMAKEAAPSFLLSLVSTCIQFLQQQMQQSPAPETSFTTHFIEVRVIIAAIIPFLLRRLSSQHASAAYAEVDKMSLQLIFAAFNVLPDDVPRQAYLAALFGPICVLCSRRGEVDPSTLMCGKGVTHIARSYPQLFRQEISVLQPEQTATLQNLMRLALQNMQTQPAASASTSTALSSPQSGGVGGGTPGSIKKLDMKKWNKK
jgi:hypothetical protein